MLTYKLISKKNNILEYQYFPHGKDIKISGGIIQFDIENKTHIIKSVAQLDILKIIKEEEYSQIINHINVLREENNAPLIPPHKGDYEYYEFADKLINEINLQILNNDIKDKGIVLWLYY